MPNSSHGLFPLGFQTKILYTFIISAMHATFHTHLILLVLIIFGEALKLNSLCSLLQSLATSSPSGPNIIPF